MYAINSIKMGKGKKQHTVYIYLLGLLGGLNNRNVLSHNSFFFFFLAVFGLSCGMQDFYLH